MAGYERDHGSGINLGSVFFFVFVLFLFSGCVYVLVAGSESGYLQSSRTGKTLISASDTVKDTFGGVGKSLKRTFGLISGDEEYVAFYSLEGTTETREKTGLDIENIEVYGVTGEKGQLQDDIVSRANVLVYRFPEDVERFNARVGCYLEEDEIQGIVSTREEGDVKGLSRITIVPDSEGGTKTYSVSCTIPKEDVELLKQTYTKKTIRYDLDYLRDEIEGNPEKIFLDVFLIDEEIYNVGLNDKGSYVGRENDAFKELAGGEFRSYGNPIISRMLYQGDVEAKMDFEVSQPLVQDEEYWLRFQFQNRKGENANVTLRGFRINLPEGFEFTECKYLDYSGELKEEYHGLVNSLLNNEKYGYQTIPYRCKVRIHNIKNIRQDELIKLDPNEGLTADLEYALKISKKQEFSITNLNENIA